MASMTEAAALQRFAASGAAVLGTADDTGAPHLVPVTFALVDDFVVFAVDHKPKTTTRLRRLANIAVNPVVSFLAQEYQDDWTHLWWVRVDARAEPATSGSMYDRAVDGLAAKYGQYRERRPNGVVVISRVTGVVGWTAQIPPATPQPDDKDWTWVLQERCQECGFDSSSVERTTIPDRLLATTGRWRSALRRSDAGARPAQQVWSILEYACHVRDVHKIFRGRAGLILDRDDPQFANWDQDETPVTGRYWQADAARVAAEIDSEAVQAAEAFTGLTDRQWGRTGRRSNGSVFTMETLGRYYLHDIEHHLHDVGY